MTIVVHGITTEDLINRIYLCSAIQYSIKRMASVINFQKAKKFPPDHGEWFLASDGVILCCVKCKSLYSVNSRYHTIDINGQLIPSWICINCGSHVIVHLNCYSDFAY